MPTLKKSIEDLVQDLKEWSKALAGTDSEKAKEIGKEIAKYAETGSVSSWKNKLEAPLKELSALCKGKIGLYD